MVAGTVDDRGEPGGFERVRGDGHDPREILRRRPVEVEEPCRLIGGQRVLLRQCRQLLPVIAMQLGQKVRIHASTLSETACLMTISRPDMTRWTGEYSGHR